MENQILIALKNNKLLKNILFDDLNLSNIKGDLLTISEGEILFREGNDSDFLYLVVSGEVNLLRKRQGSKATSLLFNDHGFLGCEEFIESSKRQATAVALRDSYIIALTKDEVDNLIDQNDEILHNIYEAINANDMNHFDAENEVPEAQTVDFTSTETIKPKDNSFASKVFQSTDIDPINDNKPTETESEQVGLEVQETTTKDFIKDDEISSQFNDEDQSIIKTNFNVPSSEISTEELDVANTETSEQILSTNEIPTENADEEIIQTNFNDIVITEGHTSDTIENELKDSLKDHNHEIESLIEEETEDLLDKYEDEVTSDGLDPLTPVESNDWNSSSIEQPADIKVDAEKNDSHKDDEFLLNQNPLEILEAQAPMTDLVDEVKPETNVEESHSDDITSDTNIIDASDENLEEKEDNLQVAENMHEDEIDDTEAIQSEIGDKTITSKEATDANDYSNFIPNESQLSGDEEPTNETAADGVVIDSSNIEDDEQKNDVEIKVLSDDPLKEELEEVNPDDANSTETLLSDEKSLEAESIEKDQLNEVVQSDKADEDETKIELIKDELTEDIFSNYDDDKSLEPLIPSSYKINFHQDDEQEESESKLHVEETDDFRETTQDNQQVIPDNDFNFDERFGKIDPFYDAELANKEADVSEENESVTSEETEFDKSDNADPGFIEAEPFTTPLPEQDDEQITIITEEMPQGEEVMLDNIESEGNKIEDTSARDSELHTDDVSKNDVDSQADLTPKDAEKDLANGTKYNSTSEWEQTVTLLEKINKAAEQVNSNIQIDEVLKNIVDSAVELTQADRGTLYIVDKNKNEIWSKFAMGNEFKEIKLQIGEGIAGWVAQTGEVINLDKVQDDPRFNTDFDKTSGYETKSMLCFPIKDRQAEVVGVVQLLNSKNDCFTKLDEEFLESLSIHAAMALQNAGLVEKLLTSERVLSLGKMANFLIQDIKKPIMVSKRYAEHLKSKSLDQDVTRVVEMLLDQLNHIADLVQSTSSYSEGQIVLRSVVSKLNETLDDCILRLDSLIRASACQINKKYDNELNVKISEKQFYQAIQSIVKNACQAMPEGGNILISTEKVEDRVLIKIKDQGLGIPDSLHDKIFEPFMTHGKKDATGLGLSITKKIIEEHGGKLSVTSNVGDGATFVIDLPIVYAV